MPRTYSTEYLELRQRALLEATEDVIEATLYQMSKREHFDLSDSEDRRLCACRIAYNLRTFT